MTNIVDGTRSSNVYTFEKPEPKVKFTDEDQIMPETSKRGRKPKATISTD